MVLIHCEKMVYVKWGGGGAYRRQQPWGVRADGGGGVERWFGECGWGHSCLALKQDERLIEKLFN